jgi:hypothetical protein
MAMAAMKQRAILPQQRLQESVIRRGPWHSDLLRDRHERTVISAAATVCLQPRHDVARHRFFPSDHQTLGLTHQGQREIKIQRSTREITAITQLAGSQLLEQQVSGQLERRCFFFEATMVKVPDPQDPLEHRHGSPGAWVTRTHGWPFRF